MFSQYDRARPTGAARRKLAAAMIVPAAAMAFLFAAAPALATGVNTISYVSATGNDGGGSNTCSVVSAPCQTIGTALQQTVAGGEVVCVGNGAAGFDFTISQAVTIDCAGATGAPQRLEAG